MFLLLLAGAWVGGPDLFLALNGARMPAALDPFALAFSELGNGVLTALLLALLVPFRRREALTALLAVLLVAVASPLLKHLFLTPRPPAVLDGLVTVVGPAYRNGSFPSGHTATAFAAAAALRGAVPRARLWWWALLALAALVGWSRIYVGVHWPLDVAGGAFLGWALGEAARGPLAPLVTRLEGWEPATERAVLLLGLACAAELALLDPMLAHLPGFLRFVGAAGALACLALLFGVRPQNRAKKRGSGLGEEGG